MAKAWRRRLVWSTLVGMALLVGGVVLPQWKAAIDAGGQTPAEPFRIAGNLYYVGASDVTAFLLTGPKGHVLIDGGYPGTAAMILRSVERLGFRPRDVRILLNSHAHPDHAGGLAALKRATGAELWASTGDAGALESGGDDAMIGVLRPLVWSGLFGFPPVRVDRRFGDGARVRLGTTELTAHVTAGHTRGCTSWSFDVRDGRRRYRVVEICSLSLPANLTPFRGEPYPGFRRDYARSLRTLRALDPDIWLASHARAFGRWRKFQAMTRGAGGNPFVDREGYRTHLDRAASRYREAYAPAS